MTAAAESIAAMPAGTVAGAMTDAARRLAAAGIPEPRFEARILIGHALGVGMETVIGHPERELSPGEIERIAALLAARCARRPLAQLTGRREFWSLAFEVSEDTLDPRADSECLIEAALARIPERNAALQILDLGTGTGCLLLALLNELPNARGTGTDISMPALAVARRNAAALSLAARTSFLEGEWGRGLEGPFDVILANPPYVPGPDLPGLQPEVALFEPRLALDGGADGLDCYRALAPDLARLLAPGGFAVIEIGDGQRETVVAILENAGLGVPAVARDLGGRERGLVARGAL